MPDLPVEYLCRTPEEARAAADRRYRWGLVLTAYGAIVAVVGLLGFALTLPSAERTSIQGAAGFDPVVLSAACVLGGGFIVVLGLLTASGGARLHRLERYLLAEGDEGGRD